MTKIIYHPHYNIGFMGLENLHPFDSKKYGRAYQALRDWVGQALPSHVLRPDHPATPDELATVHAPAYLAQLKSPPYAAQVLELPFLRHLPGRLIDAQVLKPMRWAVSGTVLAAKEAMSSGLAINLSGGYHHAKPKRGEGFCAYSDIALAINMVRMESLVSEADTVVYIDLDAHQGNGVCHCFLDDERLRIFDLYNGDIYPAHDTVAQARIDWNLPVPSGCQTDAYLALLKKALPAFLSEVQGDGAIGLAVYTAGTDVYEADSLGQLGVSAEGILERDMFVIQMLQAQNIPTLMVLGGGYSPQSYQWVVNTVQQVLTKFS